MHWGRWALVIIMPLLLVVGLARAEVQAQDPARVPVDHIIVIYFENRSFDNLFGLFPGADGLENARAAAPQVDLRGQVYPQLPPVIDATLSPPAPDPRFPTGLPNAPWNIGTY